MRRFDNSNSGLFLFFQNLLMQLMHLGPMHLRLVVVLCMVAVVEPDQIVKLVVTANAPSHWLVRISAEMTIISVQISKEMAEEIEQQTEQHKLPNKEKIDYNKSSPRR